MYLLGMVIACAAPRQFEQLRVGATVYENVRVREVTPAALVIFHKGGIAQVPLQELSQELQEAYGYDSEKAAAYERELEAKAKAAAQKRAEEAAAVAAKPTKTLPETIERVMGLFGAPPTLQEEVDFREEMRAYGLYTDNQGLRPSCAVFAVTSALELVNARAKGQSEPLSEEYLIWATRETLGLNRAEEPWQQTPTESRDADTGFTLFEVVQALGSYGIPLQEDMPNTFGKGMGDIDRPDDDLIASARTRQKLRAYLVPGRERTVQLGNMIHALNGGLPVVLGMRWPPSRSLRTPLLSEQTPREDYSHAVTLVGYRAKSDKLEDTVFIFRNSWGNDWGAGGYGFVTWGYLSRHLDGAVILDVIPE